MGLAYLAIASESQVKEMELRVPPRRTVIKRRLSNQALIQLRKMIASEDEVTG